MTLGTGKTVQGQGKCKDVQLTLHPNYTRCADFFPLELGHANIILGIQWLETLGLVTTNWKLQIMEFDSNGQQVVLMGNPSLGRSGISLKSMLKTLHMEGEGMLI